MKSKSAKNLALITGAAIIFAIMLVFSGLAIANAENNGEEAIGIPNPFETLFSNPASLEGNAGNGINIYNSDGSAAVLGQDYTYDEGTQRYTLLKNDMRVQGTSLAEPGDNVGFITDPYVSKLTLENIYINYTKDYNALLIAQEGDLDSEANAGNFTLTIKGQVYIYQNYIAAKYNHAIFFESRDIFNNFVITGDSHSYLECYTAGDDAILSHDTPIIFAGALEAFVWSEGGDSIDWDNEGEGYAVLTLKDNVSITFGNPSESANTAVRTYDLNVIDNANMYAINYNALTANLACVTVKNNFTVDTYGEVIIDAYNDYSWQAIDCWNDLTILKCSNFMAIANECAAVAVSGMLSIYTPNVYFTGGYIGENNTNWRGALEFPKKPESIYLAPWISMYGDKDLFAESCHDKIVVGFTHGSGDTLLFTTFILQGNIAPYLAKTIKFTSSYWDAVEIPGRDATYEYGGYKSCYLNTNTGQFFEDQWNTRPIENYPLWITVGDGYIRPLKYEFDPYRDEVKANCDLMLVKGDIQEVRALIDAAKANIDAYQYNNELSLDENKAALDAILTKLAQDIASLPIPGGGGEPVNPDVAGGGSGAGSAETSDPMPVAPLVALFVIAALSSALTFKKYNFSPRS